MDIAFFVAKTYLLSGLEICYCVLSYTLEFLKSIYLGFLYKIKLKNKVQGCAA
jgi:hypothetical protein